MGKGEGEGVIDYGVYIYVNMCMIEALLKNKCKSSRATCYMVLKAFDIFSVISLAPMLWSMSELCSDSVSEYALPWQ